MATLNTRAKRTVKETPSYALSNQIRHSHKLSSQPDTSLTHCRQEEQAQGGRTQHKG